MQRELTLEENHKVVLGILERMIQICDNININYFIAYGSLIGAVRHSGFIPWDDDLDTIMLRNEYEKFIRYCIEHHEEIYPYKLICAENNPDYPYTIARLIDVRYKVKFDNIKPYGCGAFIDIYPFDGAGNANSRKIHLLNMKKKILKKFLHYNVQLNFECKSKNILKKFVKYIVFRTSKMFKKEIFLNKLENLKNTYVLEDSEYVACIVWNEGTLPVQKWHYESYELLEFEGIKVKVPKDYDTVLRASYGDYMRLPPVENRVPTHEYSVFKED
jgi:lipopolysaccharide cholinephosphotransferase